MTVVAIWYEREYDILWSVADTRISKPGPTGGYVFSTNSGVKLFSLPISCRVIGLDPSIRQAPYFSTSFGFAFAGDVLPAVMTVATVTTIAQEFIASSAESRPSLWNIAELVRKLSERFSKEVLASTNQRIGRFDAAVFGLCPIANAFEVYHLHPEGLNKNFCMRINHCEISDSVPCVVLGSGKERLLEKLEEFRSSGEPFGRTVRLPMFAVDAIIREDHGDVGGSRSLGIASRLGFSLYSSLVPFELGKPLAWRSFNGIDLDTEIGMVGPCMVGMRGMTG